MKPLPYALLCGCLFICILIAAFASLLIGPAAAGLGSLFGKLTGEEADTAILIMREIRLPRMLLAVLIGGSLGLSGAALQGLLRNPLAEPGIIGVSGAASLGAVIALYFGLSAALALALPLLAIIGALLAAFLLHLLAGRQSILTLILAGVALTSLTGALTALALNLSPNPFAAYEIVTWMLGSLTDRSMVHVTLAAPFIVAGWVMLLLAAPALDALSLGEETAQSMGADLRRTRILIIGGTALCVGAATAVSGVIGFIGLIVPHLLRPLVGHRPSRLLPVSALGGALLLLLADILVRLITPGTELKLGVVTALIGAPFFLWLVLKTRSSAS
ncbi:FecCD family ABC transporter permease [Parvularcula marina]|uniref:FecCD family ABC transporter permease n=1 Tax=Parvularcula marina TaxID=2292771 RepID=UPI003511A37F